MLRYLLVGLTALALAASTDACGRGRHLARHRATAGACCLPQQSPAIPAAPVAKPEPLPAPIPPKASAPPGVAVFINACPGCEAPRGRLLRR